MTEHHDLRILGRLAAAQQEQPAEYPDRDQVEEAKRHKPRSCRNLLLRPNCRSQSLCRVLKRYTAARPRMCTCRVATSMTNKMYRRFEEDRVHGEEVAGQQSLHLSAQERPPGGAGVPRCRSGPPCAQDPPHGRLADVALLDTAAYAAALTEDDEDLAALARGGCFRGSVFDPGARGITIARSWQFGDPPHAGPRDLLTTLAVIAGRRVGV